MKVKFDSVTSERLAQSLSLIALREMRGYNKKLLDEISVLDNHLGDVGREARAEGRLLVMQKLADLDRAIKIKEYGND